MIALGIPVINQQPLTNKFISNFRSLRKKNFPFVFVDNGSNPPMSDWIEGLDLNDSIIRNDSNVGVLGALNQIYEKVRDGYNNIEYIFYTHNDVLMYEDGWDEKLERILKGKNYEIGVAGFYGAKGIGTSDIYRSSYRMDQMIRISNVSGCHRMNAAIHGFRPVNGETEKVAVMDGFSLIVSMELLRRTNGFDRRYPPHHMYDNDICLESYNHGMYNIVISMDAEHLGGRTDVGEDWASVFNKTKQEVHTEAHPVFYEKWRPGVNNINLPFYVG